ncbi:MAG: hypothetical protein IKX28_03110 [Bacteroidales bacterium]|nr:hypothetical protein [Bacteroidales bacterium]
MNKEEFDINQELEQMQQDYAALKERFDKQQIINGQLMEKAFKSDIRWLSFDRKSLPVIGVALVLLTIYFSAGRGVPWRYTIPMCLVGVLAVLVMGRVYKNLSLDTLYGEDILTATRKVKRFKQQYLWGTLFAWVAVLGVIGALSPAIYRIWSPAGKGVTVFVQLAAALAICAVVGILCDRRLMQSCNQILERLQMKEDHSNNE